MILIHRENLIQCDSPLSWQCFSLWRKEALLMAKKPYQLCTGSGSGSGYIFLWISKVNHKSWIWNNSVLSLFHYLHSRICWSQLCWSAGHTCAHHSKIFSGFFGPSKRWALEIIVGYWWRPLWLVGHIFLWVHFCLLHKWRWVIFGGGSFFVTPIIWWWLSTDFQWFLPSIDGSLLFCTFVCIDSWHVCLDGNQ